MISKELLSEVLGINDINLILDENNEINYTRYANITRGLRDVFINKYELAHKCKEWAFANGYYLTIYNDAIDVVLQSNCKILENVTNDNFMYDPNLVFKACQWILDNKGNK